MQAWQQEQQSSLQELQQLPGGLALAADGRADSPGHSAKYGTYTVLETRLGKILDIQLVQVLVVYACDIFLAHLACIKGR